MYIGDQEMIYIGEGVMYQKERYKNDIYNRFSGSLEPLKNLVKLKILEISNTDIDGGLEHLPSGIEKIVCFTEERPECKSNKIAEEMASYIINEEYQKYNFYDQYYYYDFQAWRKDNADLIKITDKSPAQKWLDENYPKNGTSKDFRKISEDGYNTSNLGKKREEVNEVIDIRYRNLEGPLKLEGFINLQELWCKGNQITSLDLSDCPKLKKLWCAENKLTILDFSNNSKLDLLDARDNPLVSLEPLKALTNLCYLSIVETNISNGLEYLPASLKELLLDGAPIQQELRNYHTNNGSRIIGGYNLYDYQAWRKDNEQKRLKKEEMVKLNRFEVSLPLKDIPSQYWKWVDIDSDWDREYDVDVLNEDYADIQYDRELYPNDKKFKNLDILNSFKKYTKKSKNNFSFPFSQSFTTTEGGQYTLIKDIKLNDWFDTSSGLSRLTNYLRDANKLFIRDGYGQVTSQEAFEFLQSIIQSREIKATLWLTQEELEKFKNENQQLVAQIQIPPKSQ